MQKHWYVITITDWHLSIFSCNNIISAVHLYLQVLNYAPMHNSTNQCYMNSLQPVIELYFINGLVIYILYSAKFLTIRGMHFNLDSFLRQIMITIKLLKETAVQLCPHCSVSTCPGLWPEPYKTSRNVLFQHIENHCLLVYISLKYLYNIVLSIHYKVSFSVGTGWNHVSLCMLVGTTFPLCSDFLDYRVLSKVNLNPGLVVISSCTPCLSGVEANEMGRCFLVLGRWSTKSRVWNTLIFKT